MSPRYRSINAAQRAAEVARDLLDSYDSLDEHSSEDEVQTEEFSAALGQRVRQCGSCGLWCKPVDLDAHGYCEECRGGEL